MVIIYIDRRLVIESFDKSGLRFIEIVCWSVKKSTEPFHHAISPIDVMEDGLIASVGLALVPISSSSSN